MTNLQGQVDVLCNSFTSTSVFKSPSILSTDYNSDQKNTFELLYVDLNLYLVTQCGSWKHHLLIGVRLSFVNMAIPYVMHKLTTHITFDNLNQML